MMSGGRILFTALSSTADVVSGVDGIMAKKPYFLKFSKVDESIQLKLTNLHSFIAYNQYGGVGHGVRYQKSAMTL